MPKNCQFSRLNFFDRIVIFTFYIPDIWLAIYMFLGKRMVSTPAACVFTLLTLPYPQYTRILFLHRTYSAVEYYFLLKKILTSVLLSQTSLNHRSKLRHEMGRMHTVPTMGLVTGPPSLSPGGVRVRLVSYSFQRDIPQVV